MNSFRKCRLECDIICVKEYINQVGKQVYDSLRDFNYYRSQLQKETERLKNLTDELEAYQSGK